MKGKVDFGPEKPQTANDIGWLCIEELENGEDPDSG